MKKLFSICLCLVVCSIMVFAGGNSEEARDDNFHIVYYHNSSSPRIELEKDEILKYLNDKLGIDLEIDVITSFYFNENNIKI